MISTGTLTFLKQLKKNNNKPWFDEHRPRYEAAKSNFSQFIQSVIDKLGKKDQTISHLFAKDCLFRINRDVRFSKDKSPYKTNMGAYINRNGKKSLYGGYYFHLEPGQSFMGGGLWMPQPPQLAKVRQEIDYNFDEFKKIISTKKFKAIYNGLSREKEYMLARMPKGYEESNPAGDYLKLKSIIAIADISDADLTSKELTKKVITAFETLQPLLEFINRSLD